MWSSARPGLKRAGSGLVDATALRAALRSTAAGPAASYIDLDFPPLVGSIDAEAAKPAAAEAQPADGAEAKYSWRRPADFLAGLGPRVFLDGLVPADVQQGSLGNCWLMCSLAALAEFPPLVRQLFHQPWSAEEREGPSHDPDGFYDLRLCKHGQWASLRVDDFFP